MTLSEPVDQWSRGLQKTRKGLFGRIADVFRKRNKIDGSIWEKVEEILIEADLGVDTAMHLIEEMRQEISFKEDDVLEKALFLLKKNILEILKGDDSQPEYSFRPYVILVIGVNGTGKTTTIGKLARQFKRSGKSVLLAASDTFRAAAGDQLEIWARRTGADVVRQCMGADPAAVAFDAFGAAVSRNADILIVDTAGRLHTKTNLMEELEKIRRILARKMESAPHETLLVIDATTGQNGLRQAKLFTETIPVTGIVLTKLDGTARGGIVVSIKNNLNIPVKWIGTGESMDDLISFDAKTFVDQLLGSDVDAI
jgi:fused signal recognition particle receptor